MGRQLSARLVAGGSQDPGEEEPGAQAQPRGCFGQVCIAKENVVTAQCPRLEALRDADRRTGVPPRGYR